MSLRERIQIAQANRLAKNNPAAARELDDARMTADTNEDLLKREREILDRHKKR